MQIKVGEIIRAKREEKKISLVAFAEELKISPGYLSQIENGARKNPKLEILLRIIDKLDIDLAMLLGLENTEESYLVKIPSLLKLILAKERNAKVLGDSEVLKMFCTLTERILDTKYFLDDPAMFRMFLNDLINQTESTIKRYMGMQVLMENRKEPVDESGSAMKSLLRGKEAL